MARAATGQVVERQTKGGRTFALRFRAYGQRQYVTLGSEGWTRQRAEAELANVMADVRRGLWRPPAPVVEVERDPTFHEFASEWMEGIRPELRRRTAEDYQWALTHHLLPFFATQRVRAITARDVDRYKAAKLREGSLSPGTINKTLTRLGQVLEDAVEYGLIDRNPARGRRRRVKVDAPVRTWLEPEQVKPLLDAVGRGQRGGHVNPDPRTRALLATLVCGGLRIGEALALRWRDVDLARGALTVRAAKTDAGLRVVDVWPELQDELATYKAGAGFTAPVDLVFATATGRPDNRHNVRERLRRAVTRANAALEGEEVAPIPEGLTPHSLRRTFASLLYLRGEDPVYVMEQMGHTDPKLALRLYAKVIGDRRRRGHGEHLVGVVGGVQWAPMGTSGPSEVPPRLEPGVLQIRETPH